VVAPTGEHQRDGTGPAVQQVAEPSHREGEGTLRPVLLAAAPEWFADNAGLILGIVLVGIIVLVVWVVQRTAIRVALAGVGVVLALFVYANRAPLEACARECECHLAGQDVRVPLCEPDAS
jgi:hypothetical protein